MFLNNKYTQWYYGLMAKRRREPATKEICERHHEIPRSMGGSNCKDNIVTLTAREHFIAHAMLVRMTTGPALYKMKKALGRMLWSQQSKLYLPRSSILFQQLKSAARSPMPEEVKAKISVSRREALKSGEIQKKISEALKGRPSGNMGKPLSEQHKAKVSAKHKGKKISDEQKQKLSEALKGKKQQHRPWSEARKRAKSEAMLGKPQQPHSEETKRKIGDAHRGKKISDEQKAKLSAASSAAMKKIWAERKARRV